MDKIELTKDQLEAALLRWEQDARAGSWPKRDDLSAEEVAAQCSDHLWGLLTQSVPA